MTNDTAKWKHFERLVTAIHKAADRGAEVRWNEVIDGRQFDVTIRFRKGMYEYLTVVECKDHAKPVSVERVDAFVTKAADVHANHAVMASTSGFQEGARDVARKHDMTLIHVTHSSDIDPSEFGAEWAGTTDVLHIQSIELEYTDGQRQRLAEQAHALTYYVHHILIQDGGTRRTLHDLIDIHTPQFVGGEPGSYRDHTIPCPQGCRVIAPDDGEIPLKPLARVLIRAAMTEARTLTGPAMFEPYLLVPDVKVENVATGERKTFSPHDLALGVDTTFEEGRFYENPQLAMYYYCNRIEGDTASLYLLESFQLGILVQAEIKCKTVYASHYVEVSDSRIIRRLQRRLDRIKAHGKKN